MHRYFKLLRILTLDYQSDYTGCVDSYEWSLILDSFRVFIPAPHLHPASDEYSRDIIPVEVEATVIACDFNSLSLGRCGSKFKSIIFERIVQNSSLVTRCELFLDEYVYFGTLILHRRSLDNFFYQLIQSIFRDLSIK